MARFLGDETDYMPVGRSQGYPINPVNDQYFGQRMQLLHREGGNRWFQQSPELLMELATGNLSDQQMLEVFTTSISQVDANNMKENFQRLPDEIQRAEFSQLAPATQEFLIGSGYRIPEKKEKKGFWDRFKHGPQSYEWFGRKAWNPFGLNVIQAVTGGVSWAVGTTFRVAWEAAIAPYEKLAAPAYRTVNAVWTDTVRNGFGKYTNPSAWKEAWDNSWDREDSFHLYALDEVRESLGDEELRRMRLFMSDGANAVYEDFVSQGMTNEEATQAYYNWYSKLGDSEYNQAFDTLGSAVNTEYMTVIRGYNALSPLDVTPESTAGKIIGTAGTLATAILIDPLTYVGSLAKVIKTTRLQTKPNMAKETIELLRNAHLQIAATANVDTMQLLSKGDMSSVLTDPKWREQYKRLLGAEGRGPFSDAVAWFMMREGRWPARFVKQFNGFNRLRFRVNDAFRYELEVVENINKIKTTGLADPEFVSYLDSLGLQGIDNVSDDIIESFAKRNVEGSGLEQLVRDYPQQITPLIGHMKVWQSSGRFTLITNGKKVEDVPRTIFTEKYINGTKKVVLNDTALAIEWATEKGILASDEVYSLAKPLVIEDSIDGVKVFNSGGLETADGYFNFLNDQIGFGNTIGSTASGTDPDLMLLPFALARGTQGRTMGAAFRNFLNTTIDWAAPQPALLKEMAAEAGKFLGAQGKFIIQGVRRDIDEGLVELSPTFKNVFKTDEQLQRLYQAAKDDRAEFVSDQLQAFVPQRTKQTEFAVGEFGLTREEIIEDLTALEEVFDKYDSISTSFLKNQTHGEFDAFFNFHEYNKNDLLGNFRAVQRTKFNKETNKIEAVFGPDGKPLWDFKPVFTPVRLARRARRAYIESKLHPAGSVNNQIQTLQNAGFLDKAKGTALALGYYPAKLAQKFLAFMPRQKYIDVMNLDTAAREMQALVDMGLMSNMPRNVRDEYLRTFINGSEAERWMVQTEFFLDFLGRSGALLNGGTDVQKFVNRFVRHSQARYSMLPGLDSMPIHGVNVNRSVTVGKLHQGQMSALNVIPDYRELGSVARYMNFYRALGWGIHLPLIDKFLARTWRPAVLLRFGYVVRNGGEELASWLFREGPRANINSRLTAKATGYQKVWDEFGMKTFAQFDDAENASKIQHGIIWGPVSRINRSFSEIAGVGDMAVTKKALAKSVEQQGTKWGFLNETERFEIFDKIRTAERAAANSRLVGIVSRGIEDFAAVMSKKISRPFFTMLHSKGLPTSQQWARKILSATDEDAAENIKILSKLFASPRVMDEQMKHVLGSFDSHLATTNNSLDNLIRESGSLNNPMNVINLTFNYKGTEMGWIENFGGSNTQKSPEFAVAAAQQLVWMGDSPAHAAAAIQMMHYTNPGLIKKLTPLRDKLIEKLDELPTSTTTKRIRDSLVTENPAEFLIEFFKAPEFRLLRSNQQWQKVWSDLKDSFYRSQSTNTEGGRYIGNRFTNTDFFEQNVDEFFEVIKPKTLDAEELRLLEVDQRQLYEDLHANYKTITEILKPALKSNDINMVSWLLNAGADARSLTGANVTDNWLQVKHLAENAMFRFYNGTPEGQQQLLSAVRTGQGGFRPGSGPVHLALQEGNTRVFVPFLPKDQIPALQKALKFSSKEQREAFMDQFGRSLANAGYDRRTVNKVLALINDRKDMYGDLVTDWGRTLDTHVPLMLMTPDAGLAEAISDGLSTWIQGQRNIDAGRIGTVDIPSAGIIKKGPGGDDAARAKGDVHGHLHEEYYGHMYDTVREEWRIANSREFERGIGRENVWAVPAESVSTGSGINPVPNSGGRPSYYQGYVYRNRETNEFMILREGDEAAKELNPDVWAVEKEMILSSNDLHNAAKEFAFNSTRTMEHFISNASKFDDQGKSIQVFYPFLEMVNGHSKGRAVDAGAVLNIGSGGQWWDNMPSRTYGYVPATNPTGAASKASNWWQNLLRNWFDGIVNPAIGAMVREPLFHHYFLKAYKQTYDVERMYYHSKKAYPHMRGLSRGRDTKLSKHIEYVEGQVRIPVLDEFLELDMNLGASEAGTAVGNFVEALSKPLVTSADEALTKELLAHEIRQTAKEFLKEIKTIDNIDPAYLAFFEDLVTSSDNILIDFKNWTGNRKLQLDRHREVAMRRGMHITSQYIDDHSIRTQFQGMVGTAIPFWFAEDTFLRRVGRSLNHNPATFRNAALWEKAGVHSGLIQEDKYGSKFVVVPFSGLAMNAAASIISHSSALEQIFGTSLGGYIEGDLAFNINMLPGYDWDKTDAALFGGEGFIASDMGFGPMLAIPIMWASQTDPSVRKMFERNLVGGRYNDYAMPNPDDPSSQFSYGSALKMAIHNIAPALVTRTYNGVRTIGDTWFHIGGDPAARSKAAFDVITLRWMQGRYPSQQEIANQPDPDIFMERMIDEINTEASVLQLLQNMTWFFGPSQANVSDLIIKNDRWEWNDEFFDLLNVGIPYEEAYRLWSDRIIAEEGEFNPYEFSPFRVGRTKKVPLSAMQATENSNAWLTDNGSWVVQNPLAATFFMPRGMVLDDDEYSAEAKSRMIAYGLYEEQTPEGFLEQMYYQSSFGEYFRKNERYLERIYAMRASGQDVTQVKYQHDHWKQTFLGNHPILGRMLGSGESKDKRERTIVEMRRILTDVDAIPDTEHKEDIISAMSMIVEYQDEMESLSNIQGVTSLRNEIKLKYHEMMESFTARKPWLNELYYSVFLPLLTDAWIAKLNAGLLEFPDRRTAAAGVTPLPTRRSF